MLKQDISIQIKQLLIDLLSLDMPISELHDDTLLLGNIPEFDSMAIVSVVTAIEETFGIQIDDDELSADVFESVEALVDFVCDKI